MILYGKSRKKQLYHHYFMLKVFFHAIMENAAFSSVRRASVLMPKIFRFARVRGSITNNAGKPI
jgi:hypothetical protein